MKIRTNIHVVIFLLFTLKGIAQQSNNGSSNYSAYPIESLESVTIETSLLDRMGYLWVVSGTTILRLDGSQPDVISGKHGFIADDRVVKIFEDEQLNKYFLYKERDYFGFMPHGKFELENIVMRENENILDINPDRKVTTVITLSDNYSNIFHFNPSSRSFEFLFKTNINNRNLDVKILKCKSVYAFLNNNRLTLFNKNGEVIKDHEVEIQNDSYFYDSHSYLTKDSTGCIYFTIINSGNIFKLSPSDEYSNLKFLDIPSTTPVIEGLWQDNNNNLIGVWKDANGFSSISYLIGMGEDDEISGISIPERTISDITGYNFEDLIIVNGYYGSTVLRKNTTIFEKLEFNSTLRSNYLEDGISVRGITGTESHIYAIREVENIFRLDKSNGQIDKKYIVNSVGDTLNFRCVRNAEKLRDCIWFSSCSENNNNYLIAYDINDDHSLVYEAPGRIQSLCFNHDSTRLFLALSRENEQSKLYFFDLNKREFELIPFFNNKSNEEFTYIFSNSSGLLLGSKSGLYILDHLLYHPIAEHKNLQSLLIDAYISYIGSYDDYILIGTMDKGLIVYNTVEKKIKKVNSEAGLVSNAICGVLRDNEGRYWVSTFNGLYVLNENFDLVNWFFENDGINHNEFNRFSFYSQNSKLYFGGVNGFLKINTHELSSTNINHTELLLSKIIYDDLKLNKTVTKFYNGENPKIELKPYQSNLKIKYISPSIWSQEFIISVNKGRQKDWMLLELHNTLNLSSLNPGKYEFSSVVRSFSNTQEKPVVLDQKINLGQYFYQTFGFKLLIMGLIFVPVILYYLNKRKEERKLTLIRERIANDLHDNLGSILTTIASRAEISMLKNNHENIQKDFNYFLTNSNKALELMRDSIWSINPNNDSLSELIERMKDYAYNSLNHKNIEIDFDIKIKEDFKINNPLWRKEVYMIFKEALANIIKHSDASKVKIMIHHSGSKFQMLINNDGILANKMNGGLGMGIQSMEKRAINLGGNLIINHKKDEFNLIFSGPLN